MLKRRSALLASMAAATLLLAAPVAARSSSPAPVADVTGSVAIAATLDRPLVPNAGGGLTGTLTTTAPWAAVVLAPRSAGSAAAAPLAGLALVPDGRSRTPVAFGSGAASLPAGDYLLYVLAPARSRVQARLSAPGLRVSTSSRSVRAGGSSSALLASVSALTDRQAFKLTSAGAAVVVGATSGQVLTHELAGCLIAGPVPAGVEETCGSPTPPQSSAAAATYGYGPATLTAVAPLLGAGDHTGVVRAETVGLGSGVGMTTIWWTWTAG